MMYVIIFALLFLMLIVYFYIAEHYNIIDKPNSRSSHAYMTIRGGGIVFPFGIILYAIFYHQTSALFLIGILVISVISFIDDVKSLPNKIRILFHLLAVTSLLYAIEAFEQWPLWLILISFILIIGTINAYNFMDGINGITGIYSLVILLCLLYLNDWVINFIDRSFIICPIIACFVFLFFNFRTKAKCFAGDVGSISVGFWIITLLMILILKTGNLEYMLFLAIYGVDTTLTIIHRLIIKQNIFKAHRLHFYQILANERNLSHLVIASIYGVAQLFINGFIILTDFTFITTSLMIIIPLSLVYIALKPKLMRIGFNVV